MTLYSGIAWSTSGYEVEVLDEQGRTALPAAQFPASDGERMLEWLTALQERLGATPLVNVVDSTNGMIDGAMMAAGLTVYRADPWHLPPPADLGSASAHDLAGAARRDLTSLTRLAIATGSLTGRSREFEGEIADSGEALSDMARLGRSITNGRRDRPKVCLTFDDGPHPAFTHQVLDVLERYGIVATFFCVGLHASAFTGEIERMSAADHEIGNHSWSHPFLPDLSQRQLDRQVRETGEAIRAISGTTPALFRPPYGSQTPKVLSWLTQHQVNVAMWDVEAFDWAMPGSSEIARIVLDGTGPGSIILLHDGGGDRSQTVAALPEIIEGLLEREYEFATVSALASDI